MARIRVCFPHAAFYFYIREGNKLLECDTEKARSLRPNFQRMPFSHLRLVYPIFVVPYLPRHGTTGGCYRPNQVRRWLGQDHETGVSDADLERFVIGPGSGIIGIPKGKWEADGFKWTVLHEVAHSVDYARNYRLYPAGTTAADFDGVTAFPEGTTNVSEHAVEVYARIIGQAPNICCDTAEFARRGESQSAADQRVAGILRRSPAFRSIPLSWWTDVGWPAR